jgi:hypothetical protein
LSANPPKNHTKLRSEVVQSLIWGLSTCSTYFCFFLLNF